MNQSQPLLFRKISFNNPMIIPNGVMEKKTAERGNTKDEEKRKEAVINCPNSHRINFYLKRIIGLYAAVSVAGIVLYHYTDPFPSFAEPSIPTTENVTDLEKVLQKAAMVDGTVILTTLNEPYAAPDSIFELFLESFKIGNQTKWLLNHLVVVALDQHAFDICLNLHSNCYLHRNVSSTFSKEAFYMTPVYFKMMWERLRFLHKLLNTGHNFVFTILLEDWKKYVAQSQNTTSLPSHWTVPQHCGMWKAAKEPATLKLTKGIINSRMKQLTD